MTRRGLGGPGPTDQDGLDEDTVWTTWTRSDPVFNSSVFLLKLQSSCELKRNVLYKRFINFP